MEPMYRAERQPSPHVAPIGPLPGADLPSGYRGRPGALQVRLPCGSGDVQRHRLAVRSIVIAEIASIRNNRAVFFVDDNITSNWPGQAFLRALAPLSIRWVSQSGIALRTTRSSCRSRRQRMSGSAD
jgi:hypothetical protein